VKHSETLAQKKKNLEIVVEDSLYNLELIKHL
jgi:hypothetical protein